MSSRGKCCKKYFNLFNFWLSVQDKSTVVQPHRDALAFSQCMLTGLLIAFKFHPPQGVYSDQQGQQRAVWTFRAGKRFKTCF